jgi:hypothetical protein
MGKETEAPSFAETVVGAYNTSYSPIDSFAWAPNDRLFTIGNGTGTSYRSDAMVVLKNGNTGIGVSVPDAQLHVSDTIRSDALTGGGNVIADPSGNLIISPITGDNMGNHRATQNIAMQGHWLSKDGDNEGVFVNQTGNVGIGTSTPNVNFEIFQKLTYPWSGGEAIAKIGCECGSEMLFKTTSGNYPQDDATIEIPGSHRLMFTLNGEDRMFVEPTGDVRIGIDTSSPGAVITNSIHLDNDGGFLARGRFGVAGIPVDEGYGERMMWHSGKAAFRAGSINSMFGQDYWTDANIGNYSVAMGSNTLASGEASTSFGNLSKATGDYSIAMNHGHAQGENSAALNDGFASGEYSVAMGYNTKPARLGLLIGL